MPFCVQAEDAFLTRSEAYIVTWETINRPAFETAKSYVDVPEDDRGFLEISYGKRRGILIDSEYFRPDELVTLGDALLWVYRTTILGDRTTIFVIAPPSWVIAPHL